MISRAFFFLHVIEFLAILRLVFLKAVNVNIKKNDQASPHLAKLSLAWDGLFTLERNMKGNSYWVVI